MMDEDDQQRLDRIARLETQSDLLLLELFAEWIKSLEARDIDPVLRSIRRTHRSLRRRLVEKM